MVNKNVAICDGCGKRTADKKCCWCEKDLCSFCRRGGFDICVRSVDIYKAITELAFCKECKHKLVKIGIGEDNFFSKEVGEEVGEIIKNYLTKKKIIDGLKNEKR